MDPTPKPVSQMRCLTYGTFDLYHEAHRSHLERCKTYGAYLVVGVLSDTFNSGRGKSFMRQSLVERIENVRRSGFADEIIIEAYDGKVNDVIRHKIDVMVICEDWQGPLDYEDNLRRYCEVVRIERRGLDAFGTPVSSTLLRGKLSIGIIGKAAMANVFIERAAATRGGLVVTAVFLCAGQDSGALRIGESKYTICSSLEQVWGLVDAVYICSDIMSRTPAIQAALRENKHVLCEAPFDTSADAVRQCYNMAAVRKLVLLPAIPSAYEPGMERLVAAAQNGKIGRILSVSVVHSGVTKPSVSEMQVSDEKFAYDLAHEALLPVSRILNRRQLRRIDAKTSQSVRPPEAACTTIDLELDDAIAAVTVSRNMVLPQTLTVIGTEGYVTTQAPWYEAAEFTIQFKEVNFEEASDIQRFQVPTRRGGFRYDIAEFISLIKSKQKLSALVNAESVSLAGELLELAIRTHRCL